MFLKALHRLSIVLLVLITGCTSQPLRTKTPSGISIMSYNVENLFDTQHDEGKDDYTFLPLALKKSNPAFIAGCAKANSEYRKEECLTNDWNDELLDMKMKRLADTILSVNGEGPDILMVQEVENLRVLKQLNDKYLQKAGYQTVVLIEGEDQRGIDVGLMSRLPLAGTPVLHPMEIRHGQQKPDWKRPLTRGILEVPLKLPNGETLIAMGLHFPSQAAPTEFRKEAIQLLNSLMEKKGQKAMVIAAGDSNVSAPEEEQHKLQKDLMGSKWKVSHLIGCEKCEGTYNYKGTWNFFDVILFSPNMVDGKASYQVQTGSIRIPKEGKYQVRIDGTPARFDSKGAVGVADHLPIYAEIVPAQPTK